jgi:acetyltransferase-like isoleucine patch superfamily enzyme
MKRQICGDNCRVQKMGWERHMSRKWWERVVKLSCVIPATFDAFQHNILEYTRSRYARRRFDGVQFGPLAYATSDCEFEVPCRIQERSRLTNTKMGRHSFCCSGCFFAYATIGRFCSIGNDVIIGTWLHPTQLVSTFPGFYSSNKHTINLRYENKIIEVQHVTVGNDVWIGHRALLLGGVTVGDGAIIGAGAVVTKDVEPYSIVAGVPARTIRKRFQQSTVDRLLELKWWDFDDVTLRRYSNLFGDPDTFIEGFAK